MSLLSFTKCFIGAGGEQAATALTEQVTLS